MRLATLVLICCSFVVLGVAAQAVRQPEATDSHMAKRMGALEQRQRQLTQELKLLEDKIEPAPPPTSMKVQSEPSIGDRSAAVAVVEFADFECQFCGQFERDTYPQVLENYVKTGKVVFFYHDFPLLAHAHADFAAEAARCAADQGKYWEMHDDLFAHQGQLSERTISADAQSLGMDSPKLMSCVSSGRYAAAVRKSREDAERMGVRATPSFLIGTLDADGHELKVVRALRGAYTYEAFRAALDGVLAQVTADKPSSKQ